MDITNQNFTYSALFHSHTVLYALVEDIDN